VVEALAEFATEIKADLVVMTTHGRSGLERLWLGSVAMSFLHRAPCPVFLVRPSGAAAPDADTPLPTGPMLIPLDGTHFAESIVAHATEFAEAVGCSISLFTVAVPNAVPMAPFGTEALLADEGALTRQEHDAEERLRALAGELPEGTTTDVSTDMTAARAIIEKADAIGAGMIAMATHGRTGIARLVLGSCADTVLRGASQPMLLYRPTESER
jgi:nucleotide-binding universal stress UspA family protein